MQATKVTSPSQKLRSRRTRTLLPTATNLLYPKVPVNVNRMLNLEKQKAKWYHDRSSRILPEIEIGQDVRVAPSRRNENWKKGTYLDKLYDRSYLVKNDADNQVLRRNREFLRPTKKLAMPVKVSESRQSATAFRYGQNHQIVHIYNEIQHINTELYKCTLKLQIYLYIEPHSYNSKLQICPSYRMHAHRTANIYVEITHLCIEPRTHTSKLHIYKWYRTNK